MKDKEFFEKIKWCQNLLDFKIYQAKKDLKNGVFFDIAVDILEKKIYAGLLRETEDDNLDFYSNLITYAAISDGVNNPCSIILSEHDRLFSDRAIKNYSSRKHKDKFFVEVNKIIAHETSAYSRLLLVLNNVAEGRAKPIEKCAFKAWYTYDMQGEISHASLSKETIDLFFKYVDSEAMLIKTKNQLPAILPTKALTVKGHFLSRLGLD